jgi:hypothetical protein
MVVVQYILYYHHLKNGFPDFFLERLGGVPVQSGKIITVDEAFCFFVLFLSVYDDKGVLVCFTNNCCVLFDCLYLLSG